jgi:hypothetical protein
MNRRLFFVCFLPIAQAVVAGTSANYTLAPDAVDGGGLRGTSANYTVNASAMAGNAGASANCTARTGFAGQLEEPAGFYAVAISITAMPATLNEGSTSQLSATLHYSDSTTVPLGAGSITWSVQSGPLSGISASGLATAAAVYQDTVAVARGSYQSFTTTTDLTVLNILPDNYETYAGDGLPDDWQVQYFGIGNPQAGPILDPDGDGWDNLFEYNACLVPTDPLSTFTFFISDAPGGGHQVTFSPREPDCTYSLLGSSNLTLWAPVVGTVTDAGSVRTILDPAGTGPRRFYSIRVQRQ